MAATTLCQPSSGNTNPYVLTTVQVLAAVGFSYLLRVLYQLILWPLLPNHPPHDGPDAAAEENIGLGLNISAAASRASLELDFGNDEDGDLGIRMPEPAYHPRGRL